MYPFWVVKGLLLHSKRGPFMHQNESFWKAKGVLLKKGRKTGDFVGVVVSAKTDDGDIFFGYQDMFKPA